MGASNERGQTETGRRPNGRFAVREGGFPSPLKQAYGEESRRAALRDGSSLARRPSSIEPGVIAHD